MFSLVKNLPERLTRITSGGKLIKEIDGLRFVAILPVVLQHLAERIHKYSHVNFAHNQTDDFISYTLSRGFVGVNIFYLVSGFVLGLPFASHYLIGTKAISLKNYFLRRVTRLEPPYIVLMTVFFLVLVTIQHVDFGELFPHFIASIFYLHNAIYKLPTPINPVAWTLEIEIQFYILAPLMTFIFFAIKRLMMRRIVLVCSILAIITLQQLTGFSKMPGVLTILGQVHYFLTGFLIADIFLMNWHSDSAKTKSYWFDVLAMAALVGIVYGKSPELLNRMFFLFCLFCLYISAFKGRITNDFLTNRWITAIGGMCYTIYLIHLPFIEFFIQISKGWAFSTSFSINFLVQALICLPLLFIISVFFFLLLEKPCMDKDWPSKLADKLKMYGKK